MSARLIRVRSARRPRAAVLVLHGGGARRGGVRVSPTQLSVLRMIPIAHRLARAGHGQLAVYRLLNTARGWDTDHTPVQDVRWALGQLREQLPEGTPVGLVGHSLGGRAALLSAGEPGVASVVALAPWVQPEDGGVDARGVPVLIVHGTADRIASPQRSQAAARLLQRTASVVHVSVVGGKHAMLRRHGTFGRPAADFTVANLLGDAARGARGVLADARPGAFLDA